MDSSTLRWLWTVIETTQANVLLRLSDTDLVGQLLGQLNSCKPLSCEEKTKVSDYIRSRTTLIRDLAQARMA